MLRAIGIALIEVYDIDTPTATTSKLINVSVLGQAGTGNNVLILGFVLGGTGQRTLLMRGIGPGLAAFGVQGALPDPQVHLLDSTQRPVDANNDWGGVNDRLVLEGVLHIQEKKSALHLQDIVRTYGRTNDGAELKATGTK